MFNSSIYQNYYTQKQNKLTPPVAPWIKTVSPFLILPLENEKIKT